MDLEILSTVVRRRWVAQPPSQRTRDLIRSLMLTYWYRLPDAIGLDTVGFKGFQTKCLPQQPGDACILVDRVTLCLIMSCRRIIHFPEIPLSYTLKPWKIHIKIIYNEDFQYDSYSQFGVRVAQCSAQSLSEWHVADLNPCQGGTFSMMRSRGLDPSKLNEAWLLHLNKGGLGLVLTTLLFLCIVRLK